MEVKFIPFDHSFNDQVEKLEKEAVQGSFIKLKMIKPSVDSRAKTFEKYQTIMAINNTQKLVGVASGSIAKMVLDDKIIEGIHFFDGRVGKKYRGNNIAYKMTREIIKLFEKKFGGIHFSTIKVNNKNMHSILNKYYENADYVPFNYLVIPTNTKVSRLKEGKEVTFFPSLLIEGFNDFLSNYSSFKIWQTYKTYHLQIVEAPPFFNFAIQVVNSLRPKKKLPLKNQNISMATMCNIGELQVNEVNEALEVLNKSGVTYLNVCCQKEDYIYNTFSRYAISNYPYLLVANFPLNTKRVIKLDVRCL